MMKHLNWILTGLLMLTGMAQAVACDVCQKNQPKGLENITHGSGPGGQIDYIILWASVAIVMVTLLLSIKYLLRPGEKNPGHIKHIILNKP